MKSEHGLGVNYGSFVLSQAFASDGPGWDDPEGLRAALWKDPGSEAILSALEAVAGRLDGVVVAARNRKTPVTRTVQF